VSLPPTVIAGLVPGMHLVGTWIGMSLLIAGMGLLIGNPIAGSIINVVEDQFSGGIIFSSAFITAGAVAFILAGILRNRAAKAARNAEAN